MFLGKSDAPSSTLHIKLRDLKKFSTPSPNSYNPGTAEKETRKAAASYSFGMKTEPGPGITSKSCPAPNAYAVPPIKDSPAYSLAARAKEQKAALVPGPGSYEVSGDRTDRLVYCLIFSPATLISSRRRSPPTPWPSDSIPPQTESPSLGQVIMFLRR